MSEYPTKSQIKVWNNDGMDPDWRPDIITEKSKSIELLKDFIKACHPVVEAARKVPQASDSEITFWKITLSDRVCNELVKAYDEVKFK